MSPSTARRLRPTLIEAELFGYEKGAFTGAERRRTGRFEAADGGTLFLDEIGSIPLEAQEKILRVVEYGSFERVGSSVPVEVDVRIVGATNADLVSMAGQGKFKRDLLDRLSFEVLFLPPLRSRGEDIMLLADHFAARMSYELGRTGMVQFYQGGSCRPDAYSWPGNIRELKNVVERAVYRADAGEIDEVIFDPFVSPYRNSDNHGNHDNYSNYDVPATQYQTAEPPAAGMTQNEEKDTVSIEEAVARLEISLLRRALADTRYNQRKAAARLGLTYDQLRGKIRKYGEGLFDEKVSI